MNVRNRPRISAGREGLFTVGDKLVFCNSDFTKCVERSADRPVSGPFYPVILAVKVQHAFKTHLCAVPVAAFVMQAVFFQVVGGMDVKIIFLENGINLFGL